MFFRNRKKYPNHIYKSLYSADPDVDELLMYIVTFGVYVDAEPYYAYFQLPTQELVGIWVTETGYGMQCKIVERCDLSDGGVYYPEISSKWKRKSPSTEAKKALYDAISNRTPMQSKDVYEAFSSHGFFARIKRYGKEEEFFDGSVAIPKEEWKKRLAIWLLKNK